MSGWIYAFFVLGGLFCPLSPRAKNMSATTVISMDIKDDARASVRGKRFAQLRASERARAVYMLASDAETKTTVVDTALVSALIREKGRSCALAGGLRCEQGHVMKFVDEHASRGSTVRAYFAHVSKSDITASEAHGAPPAHTGPRCSDIHLLAQRYIEQNVNRIVATRFKSCGECVELAFRPSGSARAEIEVTERTSRGTIRSDVVVYEGDERLIAFEVKHTHGTEPTSREGLPYLEVDAAHVVSQVEACANGACVVLKCENATTPCTDGCAARRRRAEAVRKREWRRRKGIKCASCNETGEGYGTFDGECPLCGQWWVDFLSESELARMESDETSLLHMPYPFGFAANGEDSPN